MAYEEVLGMSVDTTKNTFWIYTQQSLFELVVTREDRDVWTLYLEKKQYDMALQYAKVTFMEWSSTHSQWTRCPNSHLGQETLIDIIDNEYSRLTD